MRITVEGERPIFGALPYPERWPGDRAWHAYRSEGSAATTTKCGHAHRSEASAVKCATAWRRASGASGHQSARIVQD